MFAGSVYAQESQTSAPAPPPQSPGLDIQGIKTYLLGPGDVVDVRVFGQPELEQHVRGRQRRQSQLVAVSGNADQSQMSHGQGSAERHCCRLREVHQQPAGQRAHFGTKQPPAGDSLWRSSPADARRDEEKSAFERVDGCFGWIY